MKLKKLFAMLCLVVLLPIITIGCSSTSEESSSDGDADNPEGETTFTPPSAWTVLISESAPWPVRAVADDVVGYFNDMGLETELQATDVAPDCENGKGVVVFVGDGLGDATFEGDATDQTFRIWETRCGDGVKVELSGGGLLGRQYAGYEWLHALGLRFFHPEEEYVPDAPVWPVDLLQRQHTPAFKWRSTSLHLTHPLELGDVFSLKNEDYLQDALNYIDWQIKNGASYGHGGVAISDNDHYGHERGFFRSAGITLYNTQQGSKPLIDPDDPRSPEQQITDAIDEKMGDDPDNYPEFFSFSFNPTEFTEMEDTVVVEQMTLIANYMAQHYPDVELQTTNHGTAGEPTPNYGVRYFDLPKFAPDNLGVKIHTLMFYDLFRPAPVYGNENFNYFYDFMEEEYQTRKLWYFPEAAWWLTFDNQVPLYLPITIEARDRDIQGIKHMLDGKLEGHRTFGSGHEWGYWQNEYCPFRMAMDTDYRYTDCLHDMTSPMGEAAATVQKVMEDLIIQQENEFIYGDILRYLVGVDPETEAALQVGIEFHPMPPTPAQIMKWEAADIEAFQTGPAKQLQDMDDNYAALVERLNAVAEQVPEKGLPWFNEILDGVEITGLRARHQLQAYSALATYRQSQLELSADLDQQAKDLFDQAKATTADALVVIERREQGFRYQPLERAIGGGEDCDSDDNWSTYNFRVHCRTHTAYYWNRIDKLVENELFATDKAVSIPDTLLTLDQPLVVSILDPALSNVQVDFGDGASEGGSEFSHSYAATGVYPLTITGENGGQAFEFETRIAVVTEEKRTGFSGKVISPEGMDLVESVMPGVVFGFAGDNTPILGFTADSDGNILPDQFVELVAGDAERSFDGTIDLMNVPIISKSDAAILSYIVVANGSAEQDDAAQPLAVAGEMSIESIVQAVVVVGGGAFDEEGSRNLVASTLGYTPDTLPATVPFQIDYTVQAD